MEKEIAFQILNIQETKDEETIRTAYRTQLRKTNPEDDPEGFKRLRQAYETAVEVANTTEEQEEGPKTEVDLWLDKVEEYYQDLLTRCQVEGWRQLLKDPVCEGLDTSLEAREKMLVFLLNHIHLPHSVWKLIDETFDIVGDIKNLKQYYPEDFLNYIAHSVNNKSYFPYHLFEYRSEKGKSSNGDSYINGLMSVKKQMDAGDAADALRELDELQGFNIYHPYEDVERLRVFVQTGNKERCREYIQRLTEKIPDNLYSRVYIGEAYSYLGDKEKAYEIWQDILKEEPNYYQAKYDVACYLLEEKEYYQAKDVLNELLELGGGEKVEAMLRQINGELIPVFQRKLEQGEEDEHYPGGELTLELGWCLFQNDHLEEAIALLEKFEPEEKEKYDYCNLFGRLLYHQKEYQRAIKYLKQWWEILWNIEDDGTEKTQKRLRRKSMAANILSSCYHELGEREEALKWNQKAVETAEETEDWLGGMQQQAALWMDYHEYAKVVDVCDQLLLKNEHFYPAYVLRQEACYELNRGHDVVSDYFRAVELFPGYYKPYMFAAEMFFFHSQYQDGLDVLERAKKNGVELTPRMRLYEIKLLRNMAQNKKEREKVFQLLEELEKVKEDPESDLEDPSELECERALLFWDEDDLDKALQHMKRAVSQNPERLQYRLICGNIQADRGKYMKALKEYDAAAPEYEGSANLEYGRALCMEGLGEQELAIEYFQKALEHRDTYADACEKISDYYRYKYHNTYNREYLEKALEYATRQLKFTENCYYLVNRGLLYMNALELEPAIADFEKALTYRQEDWPAWNNLGCCYKYLGQFEKAISCFEKAVEYLKGDKDVLPHSNMADCYEALGQYEKAISCYRKALINFPDDERFWSEIGDLYYYMGEYSQALEAYKHAQSDSDYFSNVGNIWIKQGDRKKGIGYYKKGIRAASGREKARQWYILGQLYTDELRDYKKGIACLQKAKEYTEYYSDWFNYERYIAKACYLSGDKKKAQKHAQKARSYFEKSEQGSQTQYLEYKPYTPARLATFGWLYLCLGEEEKAEKYFHKMEQITRCKQCRYLKCFESTLYMGDIYMLRGDKERAREAYQETLVRNPHCQEAIAALQAMGEEITLH